eukprot:7977378-Karenia_brevis.AAC.1
MKLDLLINGMASIPRSRSPSYTCMPLLLFASCREAHPLCRSLAPQPAIYETLIAVTTLLKFIPHSRSLSYICMPFLTAALSGTAPPFSFLQAREPAIVTHVMAAMSLPYPSL